MNWWDNRDGEDRALLYILSAMFVGTMFSVTLGWIL